MYGPSQRRFGRVLRTTSGGDCEPAEPDELRRLVCFIEPDTSYGYRFNVPPQIISKTRKLPPLENLDVVTTLPPPDR